MRTDRPLDIWLAAGVRTPFAKVDGALAAGKAAFCCLRPPDR
jgi:hypothetical protein